MTTLRISSMAAAFVILSAALRLDAAPAATPSLQIDLTTDKAEYRLGEKMRIEVKITNRADEPVRLFHELRWGFVGGTQIVISTSEDGQTVHPRLLEHDGLMPHEGSDPDNYIALAPRHFFGSSRVVDVASYFPAAGKYRVRIEYSPPVGAKLGGRPTLQTSWSASSRTTFITIKP